MSQPRSQSRARRGDRWSGVAAALLAALAALSFLATTVCAQSSPAGHDDADALGIDSSIGRLQYRPGRGLHVGDTGLTIGGFVAAEAARLEDGEGRGGIEGVNFLISLDPVPYLHLFSELSTGPLAESVRSKRGVRSTDGLDVDRLYVDAAANDSLNVRFGQFFTPIGRWNQAPADPFLWTTSEPLIVDGVFDETVKGAMVFGTLFPRGGALAYSLYGTFLDPVTRVRDAPEGNHGAGARLEWTSLAGWSVGASYFAAELSRRDWHHLAGVDALWQPNGHVELSAEALVREGTRAHESLWGLYAQAVLETVPTLYAVGRYERFHPPGDAGDADLFDIGLTWIPAYYLRLKADYRFANHPAELSTPGFRASFSLLF